MLGTLEDDLSRLIESLESFTSHEDVLFLSRESSKAPYHNVSKVRAIEQVIEKLRQERRTLLAWLGSCEQFTDRVSFST
jgi:hypothetical protein